MPQLQRCREDRAQAIELNYLFGLRRRFSGREGWVSQHECGGNGAALPAANARRPLPGAGQGHRKFHCVFKDSSGK
jgi:hypothetical protein